MWKAENLIRVSLEQGNLNWGYRKKPSWAPLSLKPNERKALSFTTVKRARLVSRIFESIASDVHFHQAYGVQLDATYLTDLPGEAEFLALQSKNDELSIRTAAICEALTHELPFIQDMPIRELLKLREQVGASFEAYRGALTTIVREHIAEGKTTEEQAKEIYSDVLLPRLAELRSQAQNEYRVWAKKSTLLAGFALLVVGLGATGALDATRLLQLVAGAGSVKLLDLLGDGGVAKVRNHNLYMLLRLQQANEKRGS